MHVQTEKQKSSVYFATKMKIYLCCGYFSIWTAGYPALYAYYKYNTEFVALIVGTINDEPG